MGVETDDGKSGRIRKSGRGRHIRNVAYVQFLGERGGEVFLDVFARPEGGIERLPFVREILGGRLGTGSVLHTDRARARFAFAIEKSGLNPNRGRVNHSAAGKGRLSWNLWRRIPAEWRRIPAAARRLRAAPCFYPKG